MACSSRRRNDSAWNTDCDGQVDEAALKRNIACGVYVRIGGKAAVYTGEKRLRLSVRLGDESTGGTGSACVFGVNEDNRDAGELGFVFDKAVQLPESPAAESLPVGPSDRLPGADALQIFKDNGPLCAFGLRHDSLADLMIDVFSKAGLFLGDLFEMALGGFGSASLKRGFELSPSLSYAIDPFAGKSVPVGSRGNVHDALVYTQKTFGFKWSPIGKFYYNIKKKFAILKSKIRLSLYGLAFKAPVFAYDKGNFHPTVDRVNACNGKPSERQKPLVINDGREFFEPMQSLFIKDISSGGFCDGTNNELGGKLGKLSPSAIVNKMVKLHLVEGSCFKCFLGNVIAGVIKNLHGFKQGLMLDFSGKKLNFNSQFHIYILGQSLAYIKDYFKGGRQFLPALKDGVSAA